MVNSISGSPQIAQGQKAQQIQHQTAPAPKKNQQQPPDSVVLSAKASGANDMAKGDPDHDGR